MKREVVVSITRKPKNLVALQDGIEKSQTPALRTGNGELRPLSSGTTLLTESDFCLRKPPYREGDRVEKVHVCGEGF